jgi:hypothetical protein
MKKIVGIVSVIISLTLGTAAPRAEGLDAFRWLRNQPLTLFDLGIVRLDRDITRVSRWLLDAELLDARPAAGIQVAGRRRSIIAFVSIEYPPDRRTGKECRRIFRRVAGRMIGGAPEGPGRASWYLQSTFFPQGREWTRPTPDFADRLVRLVQLQVVLNGTSDEGIKLRAKRVSCVGALDADRKTVKLEFTN